MKKRTLLKGLLAATLVCATGAFAQEAAAVKGNPDSKIYHLPACQHYAAKGSTVAFKSEEEAKQAGYKPCRQCGKAQGEKGTGKKADKKAASGE